MIKLSDVKGRPQYRTRVRGLCQPGRPRDTIEDRDGKYFGRFFLGVATVGLSEVRRPGSWKQSEQRTLSIARRQLLGSLAGALSTLLPTLQAPSPANR
jgi:hypothetical protein